METLTSLDPRTGEPVGSVPITAAAEIAMIVERSRKAFTEWSATPPRERRRFPKAYKRAVLANTDRIASVVGAETGKLLTDAYSSDVTPERCCAGDIPQLAAASASTCRLSPRNNAAIPLS
jgi:acyl-CoA reductase-like NAD-dependent aldehyde dehydrogenase